MKDIIVMGGSFNPPTIAHLKVIQAAMDAMDAEVGYLVPVSHAYLKRKMVKVGCGHLCIPTATRLEMLQAMIAEDARLRVYEGEINEPFAITPRTMELVQERHPEARIWFVAGEDKLELLETLTRKYAFLPRFGAVVFARGGNLEQDIVTNPKLSACRESIAIIEPPAGVEGISSTAIREHLFDPDTVATMLHPAVLPLLRKLRAEDFPEEIIAFREENAFLGNDYPTQVVYEDIVYSCAESAFQASKSDDPTVRRQFAQCAIEKAKQKGNMTTPRAGWEEEKEGIMRRIVRMKFQQNPALREALLDTGDLYLINGAKGKKDTYWGVNTITWAGENRLGLILMDLREAFRKEMLV